MTKRLSLGGRLRMAAACPDANAQLLAEAADAIEQHEAFKQEVSDAVEQADLLDIYGKAGAYLILQRFIIPAPKPDPLVAAVHDVDTGPAWDSPEDYCNKIRAALEARGLEIRSKSDD
jgi:hypothetical protein